VVLAGFSTLILMDSIKGVFLEGRIECMLGFNFRVFIEIIDSRAYLGDSRVHGVDSRVHGVDLRVRGGDSRVRSVHSRVARFPFR
jgi:hypothetical protein